MSGRTRKCGASGKLVEFRLRAAGTSMCTRGQPPLGFINQNFSRTYNVDWGCFTCVCKLLILRRSLRLYMGGCRVFWLADPYTPFSFAGSFDGVMTRDDGFTIKLYGNAFLGAYIVKASSSVINVIRRGIEINISFFCETGNELRAPIYVEPLLLAS